MLEPIFHELNQQHFSSELPLPVLSWNSRLQTTAGRFCPGSRNPLFPRKAQIEVASYLQGIEEGLMHIRDTMLHEMIHYQLWHQKKPYGHTEEFYSIMKRVGAKRYNPVPKMRPVKYWYECLGCKIKVPARRKFGTVACAKCCKKYTGGEFSSKFLLVPALAPLPEMKEEISMEEPLSPAEIISRIESIKRMIMDRVSTTNT